MPSKIWGPFSFYRNPGSFYIFFKYLMEPDGPHPRILGPHIGEASSSFISPPSLPAGGGGMYRTPFGNGKKNKCRVIPQRRALTARRRVLATRVAGKRDDGLLALLIDSRTRNDHAMSADMQSAVVLQVIDNARLTLACRAHVALTAQINRAPCRGCAQAWPQECHSLQWLAQSRPHQGHPCRPAPIVQCLCLALIWLVRSLLRCV